MLDLMRGKSSAQQRKLLARFQSPEALGGFLHRRRGPAQCHRCIPPAFDVAADAADRAQHVLDDVGAGERAAQRQRQAKPKILKTSESILAVYCVLLLSVDYGCDWLRLVAVGRIGSGKTA